jgi:hypothetical protein
LLYQLFIGVNIGFELFFVLLRLGLGDWSNGGDRWLAAGGWTDDG